MDAVIEPEPENMGEIETNLRMIAVQIFSQPPKPPCTIFLDFSDIEKTEALNNLLTQLMWFGIKHKYGEDISPYSLSEEQIETVKKYMRSIGFEADFEVIAEENRIKMRYKPFFQYTQNHHC